MRGNKLILRIVCLLTCFTLLMGLGIPAAADTGETLFDLNSLGITSDFDVAGMSEVNVTRGELAQLIVNLMGMKPLADSYGQNDNFDDIAACRYRGAINLLYEMQIISGSEDRLFEPDRYVRFDESCKMFVNALGYDKTLTSKDLSTYLFTAEKIGVTRGVDASQEYLTFGDAAVMLENTLDISKVVPARYSVNSDKNIYVIDNESTFRNDFAASRTGEYVKMRGVVTADVSTYLFTQNDNITDTQLEVDGKLFDYDGTAPLGLVGMEVDMYVLSKNGRDKIISVMGTSRNVITEVRGDDIESFDRTRLKYYAQGGGVRDVKMNEGTKFIYNNHLEQNFDPAALDYENNLLTVRAIDNNYDGTVDVVSVFEYIDRIVENSYPDSERIILNKEFKGSKSLLLGAEDTTAYVEYYNADGSRSDFSIIQKDTVLSIAMSYDGLSVRIVACSERVKGFVEMKSSDYVKVNGQDYTYSPDASDISSGKNVELWLNYTGEIVYYEELNDDSDFAFVYAASEDNSIFGKVQIKVIIPGPVASKTIDGAFNETTNETSSVTNLYLNNGGVLVYDLASRVVVNGKTWSAAETVSGSGADIKNHAVRYSLNSDGEIKNIDFIEPNGGGRPLMYYNSSEQIFGTGAVDPFGINDKTLAVCLPVTRNGNISSIELINDTELTNFKMELTNANSFYVSGYDVDSETHIAPYIVVEQNASNMHQVGNPGTLIAARKNVGLVTDAGIEYDAETDESKTRITMLTYGEQNEPMEQEFPISDLISDADRFNEIAKGDLILYSLDSFGRLNNFEILQKYNAYDTDRVSNEGSDFETWCYTVRGIDFDEINNQRRRWVDVLELCYKDDTSATVQSFDLLHNKNLSPIVFILNKNGSGKIGSVSDISVNDRVVVYNPSSVGDVTAIVIKR